MSKWYEKVYRRNLVDMHITDWKDEFFSKFDPDEYFRLLKKAKIQSPMIYLQSHTGLCNWDTKTARTHNAFVGNNKVKRLVDLCKTDGMKVVGYYSITYNNWAEENHPEWAMREPNGESALEGGGRYGLVCPNNLEYRAFVKEQIREMAESYPNLDGIFFDMPFWSKLCHCDCCKARWAKEEGGKIPDVVDWRSDGWKSYVRKLQLWMYDFTYFIQDCVKECMPNTTCEFNYAAIFGSGMDWKPADTELISDCSEFVSGDLYGDLFRHSFCAKYYYTASKNQPFEYMNVRCDKNLREHTASKTEEFLRTEIMLTALHHGASLVIDAIDPVGTLDERVYELIGNVFAEEEKYEKYFEGELFSEVATYFDTGTQFSSENLGFYNRHTAMNATNTLTKAHIPVCVLGNGRLNKLNQQKVVVAGALEDFNNQNLLELISYVKNGGCLYLSGESDKRLMKEFFGAEFKGYTKESKTYIRPIKEFENHFGQFTDDYPMPFKYRLPIFEVADNGTVKGYITLPYTDPAQDLPFASIHSDPPGIKTDIPAILEKEYGKGKVVWCAGAIENDERSCMADILVGLVKYLASDLRLSVDMPKSVEIIVFKTDDGYHFNLIDLVNYNEKVKKDYEITFECEEVEKVVLAPNDKEMPFTYKNGKLTISGTLDKYGIVKVVCK